PNRADHRGEMRRAAVAEIVTVDRGDDHVLEPELRRRLRDPQRFRRVERPGKAGLDVAECTSAGADIAHDHEGGVFALPALADIGAARLLADRVQSVRAHDLLGLAVALRHRRLHPDPVGLAQYRRVGPMRLFRVARAGSAVENDAHGRVGSCWLLTSPPPPAQAERRTVSPFRRRAFWPAGGGDLRSCPAQQPPEDSMLTRRASLTIRPAVGLPSAP